MLYMQSDGSFDLDTALEDYESFLQNAPEKNKMYLKQAMETVEYRQTKLKASVFGYSEKADAIVFDPSHPAFANYDFRSANTHELGHRIDKQFVQSWENEAFSKAIKEAGKTLDANPELFVQFCEKNDTDGFLSDILSALCEGRYEFPVYHDKKYWEKSGNKEKECFTNLFSLETYKDAKKLEFLNEHFSRLMNAFEKLNFSI